MDARFPYTWKYWLSALLLAALLGAQALQAAHVHGDHGQSQDCVQCKLDSGHALLSDQQRSPLEAATPARVRSPMPAAPVLTAYRIPSRGPPALSS